jgi:hypothetical protein
LTSSTREDFDENNTYRAAPATASKREPPHRRHDGREMNERIAAELKEAYGAMTRFVHLMRRVCSTAPPHIIRPKTKFNVKSFRFLVNRNIKYPIIYP